MFPRKRLRQTAILCLTIGIATFSGCGFSRAQSADTSAQTDKPILAKATMIEENEVQLEPVSAIKFNGEKVSVGVISFGCTTSADFTIEHSIVNGACEIKIKRFNRDVCRRAPFVANIELSWSQPDDCRELPIVVANPLLITSDDNNVKKQMK